MAMSRFLRASIVSSVVLLGGCQSPMDLFFAFHGPRPAAQPATGMAGTTVVESGPQLIESRDNEDCRSNTLHDLHQHIRRPLCD
jgi:hypothetical protein